MSRRDDEDQRRADQIEAKLIERMVALAPPKHRHELTLSIGAHNLLELQDALERIANDLREFGDQGVSASPGWAGHWEHVVSPEQTFETYCEQLDAYLEACFSRLRKVLRERP
jgi:hypothetical protein